MLLVLSVNGFFSQFDNQITSLHCHFNSIWCIVMISSFITTLNISSFNFSRRGSRYFVLSLYLMCNIPACPSIQAHRWERWVCIQRQSPRGHNFHRRKTGYPRHWWRGAQFGSRLPKAPISRRCIDICAKPVYGDLPRAPGLLCSVPGLKLRLQGISCERRSAGGYHWRSPPFKRRVWWGLSKGVTSHC